MNAEYETGMRIDFDVQRKVATVVFRGRRIELPQPCASAEEARTAGEAYCRLQGWKRDVNNRRIHRGSVRSAW